MELEYEILVNQYAQGAIDINPLLTLFENLDLNQKRRFLLNISYLIIQSKARIDDVEFAIDRSGLKSTYTPCILIKKSIQEYNLRKMADLPLNELRKVFILFLSLFKIAYKRRFDEEQNNPSKWWYWDLSNENNIRKIKSRY